KTESAKYSLEYGEAEMELHVDAIERGEKVVLIDDLLATGGTSASAVTLIRKVGGDLIEAIFLIEGLGRQGTSHLVTPYPNLCKQSSIEGFLTFVWDDSHIDRRNCDRPPL